MSDSTEEEYKKFLISVATTATPLWIPIAGQDYLTLEKITIPDLDTFSFFTEEKIFLAITAPLWITLIAMIAVAAVPIYLILATIVAVGVAYQQLCKHSPKIIEKIKSSLEKIPNIFKKEEDLELEMNDINLKY